MMLEESFMATTRHIITCSEGYLNTNKIPRHEGNDNSSLDLILDFHVKLNT